MQSSDSLIEELSDKVVRGFLETIDTLAALAAANERDYEDSHGHFVAQKSAEVARQLQLGENEIFEIRTAGLLHDIGKVGLPDTIKSKYIAAMTAEEFTLYAKHPDLGRRILSEHSGFESIAEIVYQHHERLDGSGFPQHLRGAAIHKGALIIAVVDAYHNAMFKRANHNRHLRRSNSLFSSPDVFLQETRTVYGQTMNYLNGKTKILFDEKVVDAFTTVMEVERRIIGQKVVKRLAVNQLKPGMQLAMDYRTSFGLLVAARDETLTTKMIDSLVNLADLAEIPQKVLVID